MKKISLTVVCAVIVLLSSSAIGIAQQAPVDDYTEVLPADPEARSSASGSDGAARAQVSGRGSRRYQIGFGEPLFTTADAGLQTAVFDEAVDASADVARLYMSWRSVAPENPSPAFDATNPASPEYSWARFDEAVRKAHARGLRPLLLVTSAPDWAEGDGRPGSAAAGTWKPNPSDVADFGTAVARRYSGSFAGLPRVRDYIFWNEPNLESNLTPVWKGKSGKKPASPKHYRKMLNAFYKAVRGVKSSNRVITAGTAPYGADPGILNMRPLQFWREVLCVRGNGYKNLRSKRCPTKPKFDVLAHHPINTSGGPRRSAVSDDDISTPDLKHLVKVLRFAERKGNVRPKGKHQVWAAELWWESDPPDPHKDNPGLRKQARYYAEAFYLLWKQGASMVLPYQVRDEAFYGGPGRTSFQTGVRFVDGEAKPSNRAVRFPFVADRKNKKKVKLWGKAPIKGKLLVQKKRRKGFKTVKRFKVKPGKVFYEKVGLRKSKRKHKLRAKVRGEKSLSWKLK